jgi:hypothetical protein
MADDGDLVAGRYRLREKAGRGPVWRARDEQLDRDVAVKQLVPGQASLREARAAAKLSHPHAVTVYDVLEHQGKPFLVMELLPTCLAEVLVERGPLPRGMVADVGRQIAAALTVAHGDGILHRDVSPATVLLTHDGTAKIADFGVSRSPGTPAYLAPEVAGGAAATARSDVYSLGATLYTALEGHPPVGAVEEDTAEEDTEEVVAPARTGPLADFLLQMLRRDPDRRPAMAEAADVLAKVAAGVRKPVRPAPVARRRAGKRRVVLAAAAVGVLAGGTAIALTVTGAANRPVVAAPGTVQPEPAGCSATAQVTQSWSGGYQMLVTVRNAGPAGITGWAVTWQPAADRRVDDLWDGKIERSGASVTVVNETWNGTVTADGATTFGLVARTAGAGRVPESLTCSAR